MAFNYQIIRNETDFQNAINQEATLLYFTSNSCNVGEAVAPKLMQLIEQEFPKIHFYYVNREALPEIAAQLSVFTEPTVLVLFNGQETIRKSRHFSLNDIKSAIDRPYHIMFN